MSEAITAPDSLIVQTVEYLRDIKGGGAYK